MAPKKPNKNNGKGMRQNKALQLYNSTIPYSPGTPFVTLRLTGLNVKYTTTVTTGVIASSTAIQTGNITNFSTRFAVAFDECRITKVIFRAYPCSSANPGTVNMWVEPQSNSTPTTNLAQQNNVVAFPAGANDRIPTLVYQPTDFNYNDWIPVSTTNSVIGYFNVYTNNADFASSTTATDYLVVKAEYFVQFRGFA